MTTALMKADIRLLVSVVALFVWDDQVLLLHQITPPETDLWDLPGGRLEVAEDLLTGLRREVYEELGLTVFQVERLLTVAENFYLEEDHRLHKLDIIYQCRVAAKPIQFTPIDLTEIGPQGIQWHAVNTITANLCTRRTWAALQAAQLVET